jgi:hypothetical protein
MCAFFAVDWFISLDSSCDDYDEKFLNYFSSSKLKNKRTGKESKILE